MLVRVNSEVTLGCTLSGIGSVQSSHSPPVDSVQFVVLQTKKEGAAKSSLIKGSALFLARNLLACLGSLVETGSELK
jgi:hypothetical protein